MDDALANAIEGMRQRETQAIGAAISLRNWHDVETAYNQLRDKLDAALLGINARRRQAALERIRGS